MSLNSCLMVCHYLNDFYMCDHAVSVECASNFDIILNNCCILSIPINPAQVIQNVTRLELLGLVFKSVYGITDGTRAAG
jgi:hypothetical protein